MRSTGIVIGFICGCGLPCRAASAEQVDKLATKSLICDQGFALGAGELVYGGMREKQTSLAEYAGLGWEGEEDAEPSFRSGVAIVRFWTAVLLQQKTRLFITS